MLIQEKTLPSEVSKLQSLNKKVAFLITFMSCNLFHNNVKPLEKDAKDLLFRFSEALNSASNLKRKDFSKKTFKEIEEILANAREREKELKEVIQLSENFTPTFFAFCGEGFMNSLEIIKLNVWINMASSLAICGEKFDILERDFLLDSSKKIANELSLQYEKVKALPEALLHEKELKGISFKVETAINYLKETMFIRPFY